LQARDRQWQKTGKSLYSFLFPSVPLLWLAIWLRNNSLPIAGEHVPRKKAAICVPSPSLGGFGDRGDICCPSLTNNKDK